jgi:AAA domain/CHC2 zinc finger
MNFKPEHVRHYFGIRLQGQRIGSGPGITAKCPFHEDRTASLSINLEKAVWKCHAGCGAGGMLDFEQKFVGCDRDTAKAKIAELLGEKQMFAFNQQPEAVYQYQDTNGVVVFEKVRYLGKRFMQRKPTGKGGYEYKLGDCLKPLYRLPEVLVANEIFICEGEKDADNVRLLDLANRDKAVFVAATTNFDGAGKWRDEYSIYFAGKKVVIFPDNDEPGRKHAERVARSLFPYALGIKIVNLPGLAEKGDVSDFLKAHSAADLVAEIKRTQQWRPAEKASSSVLIPAPQFLSTTPVDVDWMVEGVIERGANGFFCASPKGGKSWAAVDLALSLALGTPWLGFRVARPFHVALISREDNPSLTGWRMRHLLAGKTAEYGGVPENLWINSRAQTPEFLLDNSDQWQELVDALKERAIEFAIFDVFNVMHGADENDNTEMRQVLRKLSAIQAAVGCGIGVVHHFSKSEMGTMTQRLRGASAIAGWAEWLVGISLADPELKIRRMDFELKAAPPPDPICYQIAAGADDAVRLELTDSPAKATRKESSRAEQYMN